MTEFWVGGVPQPKGSLRGIPSKNKDGTFRVVMKNDNPKTKEWQDLVSWHAKSEWKLMLSGAVRLSLFFAMPPPRDTLFEMEATRKPDLDKLVRCILDALTGIVYEDDCQVVTVLATKAWGETPGVRIQVEEIHARVA